MNEWISVRAYRAQQWKARLERAASEALINGIISLCILVFACCLILAGCGELTTIPDKLVGGLSPADRGSNGPNQRTHVDVALVNESSLSQQSVAHLIEVLNAHRIAFSQDWLVDYSVSQAGGVQASHYSLVLRDTLDSQLLEPNVLGYHAGTVGYTDVVRCAAFPNGVIATTSHELLEVLIDPAGNGKEICDFVHADGFPDGFTDYLLPVAYTQQTAAVYDACGVLKVKPDPNDRKLYAK